MIGPGWTPGSGWANENVWLGIWRCRSEEDELSVAGSHGGFPER